MGSSNPNAEGTSSQPCPVSSPLSPQGDAELSDGSLAKGLGPRPKNTSHSQPNTTDPATTSGKVHHVDHSQPNWSHRKTDEDEDELAQELVADAPTENHDEKLAEETKKAGSGEEEAPSSGPTRRMPRRQKKIVWKKPPTKPTRKTVWTAERLLTDPKSPLAKADLRSIVTNPTAWDVLDSNTKSEILALFPHKSMVLDPGTDEARPDLAAMMNDDTFRGGCADYTEHIAQGRHDPEWLVSAYHAHEKRSMGDFDDFLVQKVYDDWGAELPEDFKPRRAPRSPTYGIPQQENTTNSDDLTGKNGHALVGSTGTASDKDRAMVDMSHG